MLLGLSRGVLWLLGLQPAQFLLIQLVASPLPLVFDSPYYYADYELQLAHGDARATLPLTAARVRGLEGPLARRSVLTHSMAWGAQLPVEARHALFGAMFCDPARMLVELGGRPGADAGLVRVVYRGPSGPFDRLVPLPCGAPE